MANKIAVVNVNRLLDESKHGKVLSETLKTTANKWQKEITALQEQIRQTQKKIEELTPDNFEARFGLDREMRIHDMDIKHLQSKARLDIESRREEARTKVLKELEPLLNQLAKDQDVDMVFTLPAREIAFVNPDIDLTEELLKRYDGA